MATPLRTQSDLRQMLINRLDTLFTGSLVGATPFSPVHPLTIDAKHRYNHGSYAGTQERKRMGVTVSTYM
eukprot:6085838-Pleurochrysis_carterae.AAC.1